VGFGAEINDSDMGLKQRPPWLHISALSPDEWEVYAPWVDELDRSGGILKSIESLVGFVRDRAVLDRGRVDEVSRACAVVSTEVSFFG
jgi:hypothetical protein